MVNLFDGLDSCIYGIHSDETSFDACDRMSQIFIIMGAEDAVEGLLLATHRKNFQNLIDTIF